MRFNDAVIGVVLLLFGGAVTIHAQTSFPGLPGQDYGPAFFPSIIGVALALCGIALIVSGLRSRHALPPVTLGPWARSARHRTNLLAVIASLIFFIVVVDRLGFVPTSVAIMALLMIRFGVRVRAALLIAAAATLLIQLLFAKLLLVPLPWGILQPVAW